MMDILSGAVPLMGDVRQNGSGPARLIRFDGVWRRLDQRQSPDWGQVAADAGYADQAHLVREFRQFTRTTPTGFLTLVSEHAGRGLTVNRS